MLAVTYQVLVGGREGGMGGGRDGGKVEKMKGDEIGKRGWVNQ